jgi:hypothetical protein
MSAHLTVLLSLGVAILLSPENLLIGLVMASDKKSPRLAALMYAVGAIGGLALGLTIGFLVAPTPPAEGAPVHHTWTQFIVRALIAGLLVGVGLQRAVRAVRHAPIAEESGEDASGKKPSLASRVKRWFAERFKGLGGREIPTWRRGLRSGVIGFATVGVHAKCLSVSIAAGHQAMQIAGEADRALGLALFAAVALTPSCTPLVVELIRPGGSASIRASCEAFMKTNGRWIAALILLGAGAFVAWNAAHSMP